MATAPLTSWQVPPPRSVLPQFRGHDRCDEMVVVVEVIVESIAPQSPFRRVHPRPMAQSSIRVLEHGISSKYLPLSSGGGEPLSAGSSEGSEAAGPSTADMLPGGALWGQGPNGVK